MSIPTPDTSHLCSADYDRIYEPAEDTFLLLDSLEKDMQKLQKMRPLICLEIGTGTGVGITFLGKIIGPTSTYFCVDINELAVSAAMETGRRNEVIIQTVCCDLIGPFRDRLRGQCDVIIFNPPYVVTPSEEVGHGGLSASWAGGARGREVIDRLLPDVFPLLSTGGVFYLLIIKENDEDEIMNILGGYGLIGEAVMRRQSGPEILTVLKFTKPEVG